MIRFEANLSEKSLENLMSNLEKYGQKLQKAQEDVLLALAEYVYDRIIFYIPVDSGDLMNSFVMETSYYYSFAVARVYTDLFYAKYVEFGTGVVGQGNQHPISDKYGWIYDKNGHGEAGWVYPKKDGTWGRTSGQVAQKFVYKAVLDLEQNYIEIAKNVLRKKGLI